MAWLLAMILCLNKLFTAILLPKQRMLCVFKNNWFQEEFQNENKLFKNLHNGKAFKLKFTSW